MSHTEITYCRNCSAACGLEINIGNGRPVSVRGDKQHPISSGYFCVKGRASIDLHNGEDRMLFSQRQTTDGGFEPIEFGAALDEIHARLGSIIEEDGPEAVALYYGTGANTNSLTHSAMKAWASTIGTPFVYSSMTVDQSAKWVTMGRMGAFLPGKFTAFDADVLMVVGNNPVVSHGCFAFPMPNPMKWIRDTRASGLKMIVVDPRRTETAKQADIHVQIRPGEDATFFAGLIRQVLTNGMHDATFCDRFTTSLDALAQAVSPFTPDYVEARTGVATTVLEEVASVFAAAQRKSAVSGTGPNMGPDSNVTEHLIETFNAICGGYRRAGDVIRNSGALYGGIPVAEAVMPPARSWERGPKCHSTDIGPCNGEYPLALLPAEITGSAGKRIRALIVAGGNPIKALGDPRRTVTAFKGLDLLVTLDPRATDTGRLAHYQIATSLPYERHDVSAAFEHFYPYTFAQVATPIVERPAGVVDDWEFFFGLTSRSGVPLPLKRPYFGVAHDDIPGDVLHLDPGDVPEAEQIVRWMCSHGQVSYEDLMASPHGVVLHDSVLTVEPAASDDGARLVLCPEDVIQEIEQVLDRRADPRRPYRLISRRLLETMNSAFRHAAIVRRRYPANAAYLNPDDMANLGITEGECIEISSEAGSLVAPAYPEDGLPPRTISMSHGWGDVSSEPPHDDEGGFTGRLVAIDRDLQSINFMPHQSAIPVSVSTVAHHPA